MNIRPLTVGPIIGWTGETSTRLWGRGKSLPGRRCFGAARIREAGTAKFSAAKYFKMMPHFDFTGIIDFDQLSLGKRYEYQIGFYPAKGGLGDQPPKNTKFDWSRASKGTVELDKGSDSDATSFVFGSCRYLLRMWGGTFYDERGDKTFRSINRQISSDKKTDLVLMIGDQIYADDLLSVGADETVDEYFSRYRLVFTQPHIRQLMAQIPVYMTLDDHEIRNDWSQDQFAQEPDLFAAAIHAYTSYQMVHGPAFSAHGRPDIADTPDCYWYRFQSGKSRFFVLDTRTERYYGLVPPRMISGEQFDALTSWLSEAPNSATKFVVSSVPFFPAYKLEGRDKWSGFENQQRDILDYIRDNEIQRVVFLSGDVHCSLSAQLECSTHPKFKVTSVVSSSLFWPYPQGSASDFNLDGTLTESEQSKYTVINAGKVHSTDNFVRLTTNGYELHIETYGRKGALLGERNLEL